MALKAMVARPRDDGPLYELRPRSGGYLLVPLSPDEDGALELSAKDATEWVRAVYRCPAGRVFVAR